MDDKKATVTKLPEREGVSTVSGLDDPPLLLKGVRLPANVMLQNSDSGVAIGNRLQTGFGGEGIVSELRVVGTNVLISMDNGERAILFSSGMLGEVLP